MYSTRTPGLQSPWAVNDLGSTLDKLPGAAQGLPRESLATDGLQVWVSPTQWYWVQDHTGGMGGGARATIRQKGRPVTPLTQRRWSEPWVAISWCFWTDTRLLATPRNAGMSLCHHAVVDPRTYPRLSDAWIYIEGTPSGYTVSTRRMPVEQVAFSFFFFSTGRRKRKHGLK